MILNSMLEDAPRLLLCTTELSVLSVFLFAWPKLILCIWHYRQISGYHKTFVPTEPGGKLYKGQVPSVLNSSVSPLSITNIFCVNFNDLLAAFCCCVLGRQLIHVILH